MSHDDRVPESKRGKARAIPRLERVVAELEMRIARRTKKVFELEESIKGDVEHVTELRRQLNHLKEPA